MAKRKRGAGQAKPQPQADEDFYDPADSKLRIRTHEDVADSEDEFHAGRDNVLLEKARGGKRRKQYDDDMLDLSDEEVLEAGDDDDDDDVDEQVDEHEEEEEEEGDSEEDGDELSGFGASRSDYYGADALETEQDALEEEEEARRIQQKNLKALRAADFGFDENEWAGAGEQDGEPDMDEDKTVMEVLPQVKITEDMGPAERLKLLKQQYPLFEPLSKEFLNLQDRHTELAETAAEAQKTASSDLTPITVIQYRALSGYLGALAMYFALLTSTATNGKPDTLPLSPQEMQNHPIFSSIEDCQRTWQQVKDLEEDDFVDSESDEAEESIPIPAIEVAKPTKSKKSKKSATNTTLTPTATDSATAASLARRAARLARTEASLAALSTTLAIKPTKNRKPTTTALSPAATADNSDSASDLGDEVPLSLHDAAEKARRKKSLRFYTSQIAQKAAKRAAAGRIAGGDEDVPYRERFRDRQERLNREAEAKGKKGRLAGGVGAELGVGDGSDAEGEGMTNREREDAAEGNDGEGVDGTGLLASAAAKKQTKASRAAAYRLAAEQGGTVVRITDPFTADADGKRAVGYTIEKNKGLMPRRKKEVKNPRVKKRKKYEEKTKKLASMKPVFKGGEGKGGYAGQLTGIKTGLVRSTKF